MSIPAEILSLVVQIIGNILSHPDPKHEAARIIEEQIRLRAFDEAMRRAKP